MENFLGRGLSPSPDPSSSGYGTSRTHTPRLRCQCLHICALGARLGPRNPNPGSASCTRVCTARTYQCQPSAFLRSGSDFLCIQLPAHLLQPTRCWRYYVASHNGVACSSANPDHTQSAESATIRLLIYCLLRAGAPAPLYCVGNGWLALKRAALH